MKSLYIVSLAAGFVLASSLQAQTTIFSEDFSGTEANRLSSTGWLTLSPTQAFGFSWNAAGSSFTGPGSVLWYDSEAGDPAGSAPVGAYKPFTGSVDTFGIAGYYAGIGSDGDNVNFADTGAAFVSGTTYEFSFLSFKRADSGSAQSFTAEIYDVTTTLTLASESITGAIANDVFTTDSVSYIADGTESGNIGLRFTYTGGSNTIVSGVDNILLTATVPEPGTYALFAGLLGLTYVVTRRRK